MKPVPTALLISVAAIFGVAISACTRSEQPEIIVTGASTVYPIIQLVSEEIGSVSGLRIKAQAGGSTRGFEDCVAGRNGLGAMAREPTEAELAEIQVFPIALDGVGIVVHSSNPIRQLTTDQIRNIYVGKSTRWSDFGGKPERILAVGKAEGHATLQVFLEHTKLKREEVKVDAVAGDNAQVIRIVAGSENAIGYVSLGEVIHSQGEGIPVKPLDLDGVEATLENVASGTYPISRKLYLVSKGEPSAEARQVIEYLKSDAGKRIIERCKHVPIP